MSYNGSAVSISGMPIDFLTVSGAPTNNGFYRIDGTITAGDCGVLGGSCGVLNATTGAQTSGSGHTATFGPGGSFSLIGSLDTIFGAPVLGTQPIILSGAYTGSTFFGAPPFFQMLGSGNDIKSPVFLAFFGITNPNFAFDFFAMALPPPGYVINTNPSLPPNPFAGAQVEGGSTNNHAPVDEPSAVLLLGTGLFVAAGLLRGKLLG